MFKAIKAFFSKKKKNSEFKRYMGLARIMMQTAKHDKAAGLHFATIAAVQSAKAYRKAAHASVFYSNSWI